MDPLNFKPKRPFNCVDVAVSAAAEQNPEITGAETKSTINPIKRILNHWRTIRVNHHNIMSCQVTFSTND